MRRFPSLRCTGTPAAPTTEPPVESWLEAGFARVDINPYVKDGDITSGIMALPLRGSGDVWNRLSAKMVDDNGDGVINEEDGYTYTGTVIADGYSASLRDGAYSIVITSETHKTSTHVVVNGADVKKDIILQAQLISQLHSGMNTDSHIQEI